MYTCQCTAEGEGYLCIRVSALLKVRGTYVYVSVHC